MIEHPNPAEIAAQFAEAKAATDHSGKAQALVACVTAYPSGGASPLFQTEAGALPMNN